MISRKGVRRLRMLPRGCIDYAGCDQRFDQCKHAASESCLKLATCQDRELLFFPSAAHRRNRTHAFALPPCIGLPYSGQHPSFAYLLTADYSVFLNGRSVYAPLRNNSQSPIPLNRANATFCFFDKNQICYTAGWSGKSLKCLGNGLPMHSRTFSNPAAGVLLRRRISQLLFGRTERQITRRRARTSAYCTRQATLPTSKSNRTEAAQNSSKSAQKTFRSESFVVRPNQCRGGLSAALQHLAFKTPFVPLRARLS